MSEEAASEKIFGPYAIKTLHFSNVPGSNRYQISVCFDKVKERRPPQRAKNQAAQLLEHIAAELKEQGMDVSKAQGIKMADLHLLSIMCTTPTTMAEADFHSIYHSACDAAVEKISEKDRPPPPKPAPTTLTKKHALLKVLKKHGVSHETAEIIVTEQIKELNQL